MNRPLKLPRHRIHGQQRATGEIKPKLANLILAIAIKQRGHAQLALAQVFVIHNRHALALVAQGGFVAGGVVAAGAGTCIEFKA